MGSEMCIRDSLFESIGQSDGISKKIVVMALKNKINVITPNKALISKHGNELAKLAEKNNVNLEFEASVAGGIPILRTIKEGLATNKIKKVYGILNGTTNYILTEMENSNETFDKVLKKAQELGYAEPGNPKLDLNGFDAFAKVRILSALAFNNQISNHKCIMEGIENIDYTDIKIAKQLNYTPRSVKAPKGCVRFAVQTTVIGNSTDYPSSVTMIAADVFVSTTAGQGYTFTLPENLVATVDQATGIATFTQVVIYQGNTLEYEYVVEDVKKRTYLVPSDAIDTDLLKVSISPNAQSEEIDTYNLVCLLYTSPSPRDLSTSRMPSSA